MTCFRWMSLWFGSFRLRTSVDSYGFLAFCDLGGTSREPGLYFSLHFCEPKYS